MRWGKQPIETYPAFIYLVSHVESLMGENYDNMSEALLRPNFIVPCTTRVTVNSRLYRVPLETQKNKSNKAINP